jgi:DNA modification methylase
MELVWNGKPTAEVLPTSPLAKVEQIGGGDRNWLIWGDNQLVLPALLEQFQGQIDLIYIDPPFAVGNNFTMPLQIGCTPETAPKVLAYQDIWDRDAYLSMLFERLTLMRRLLSNQGSIYVHLDSRMSHYAKVILDEIFGVDNFRAEIIWKRTTAHSDAHGYGQIHDNILFYTKSSQFTWNRLHCAYDSDYVMKNYRYHDRNGRRFMADNLSASGLKGGGYHYSWKGKFGFWRCPETTMNHLDQQGKIYYTTSGLPRLKRYLDEMPGKPLQSIWDDISVISSRSQERLGYPTQKPEALLERIIQASSNPQDLVADFFCGSGTTGIVAERLGRRWIMVDSSQMAIHTCRKRVIELYRRLQKQTKPDHGFALYRTGNSPAPAGMPLFKAQPIYQDRTVDIQIIEFLPPLSQDLEKLREQPIANGLDFIDFWAIDFHWQPGQPFQHHWQTYRTRKNRTLKTISDRGHSYTTPGPHTIAIKVIDAFGGDWNFVIAITQGC